MKKLFLNALANNITTFLKVKAFMNNRQKINAIKELRQLKEPFFGLKETKDFIESYYDGWDDPNVMKLHNEVMSSRKGKKGTRKAIAQQYNFNGVDLRQIDTDSLKDLYKTIRKEMKKRGEKI